MGERRLAFPRGEHFFLILAELLILGDFSPVAIQAARGPSRWRRLSGTPARSSVALSCFGKVRTPACCGDLATATADRSGGPEEPAARHRYPALEAARLQPFALATPRASTSGREGCCSGKLAPLPAHVSHHVHRAGSDMPWEFRTTVSWDMARLGGRIGLRCCWLKTSGSSSSSCCSTVSPTTATSSRLATSLSDSGTAVPRRRGGSAPGSVHGGPHRGRSTYL